MEDKVTLYEWRDGDKTLGYGVTSDIDRRKEVHEQQEPGSQVKVIASDSNEIARQNGRQHLRDYEKKHGDLPPKNR